MNWRLCIVIITMLTACSSPDISIEDAWIRSPLPGRTMTAGYLVINNPTNTDITLVGATSDVFSAVSIHQTKLINNMAQMVPVPSLEIGAGKNAVFSPGGLHLMLMQPQRTVVDGEVVTLTLEFSDGSQRQTAALVSDTAP